MTELEQLRVDLATLEKTSNIYLGAYGYFPAHHDLLIKQTKEKIADLEEQRATADEWAEVKRFIDQSPDEGSNPMVKRYIRHLEAKVAELDYELRCERIDGGKVRDDRKAVDAERNREKLAELTTILNAIPPACGEAMELVKRRIDNVKKEMQGNGN